MTRAFGCNPFGPGKDVAGPSVRAIMKEWRYTQICVNDFRSARPLIICHKSEFIFSYSSLTFRRSTFKFPMDNCRTENTWHGKGVIEGSLLRNLAHST